ncbi:MAG: FixH family protein [Pyrinomonadaceae bacterium]
MKKIIVTIAIATLTCLILLGAACSSGSKPTAENPVPGKVIKNGPIGDKLMVTLSNDTGKLKSGEQEIMLTFTDTSGKAIDVGMVSAAALNFRMPAMGSMSQMNNAATFTSTSVPGVYKGKVKIEMAGEWQAQISFEGSAGSGKTTIPVTAN